MWIARRRALEGGRQPSYLKDPWGGSKEPRTIVAEESPTHDGRFVPPKKKRRLDLFVKVPSLKDIPVVFSETDSQPDPSKSLPNPPPEPTEPPS